MSNFSVSARLAIRLGSGFSALCSLLLLSCFYLCPKWAHSPASFKHVLFVLTIWDLISALNYQINPFTMPGTCMLQACVMQFFELGSWVYTIIISVDLARGLHQSFRMQTDSQRSSFECRPHLVFYHCLGVGYGVLTTILFSPLVLDLAGPAGAWCWSNDKTWSEVMYGGLWVGFCVIIGCSIWIYRMIQLAEQALLLRITSGDADARDVGRKRQSWALVRRLMLLPLSYILLHVPGTIRRNADRMGSPQFDSPAMAYLQGICDPSQGAVNFLLFGVLDRSLHKEMRELWRRKWPNSALSEKEFTAAVKSSDRRSKKRPSSARKSEYEVSDSDSDDDDDESGKWVEMTKTSTNV